MIEAMARYKRKKTRPSLFRHHGIHVYITKNKGIVRVTQSRVHAKDVRKREPEVGLSFSETSSTGGSPMNYNTETINQMA
ncbi:MAG: hypothetical protein PVJ21_17840, partial [Anaerolineales bacterium]